MITINIKRIEVRVYPPENAIPLVTQDELDEHVAGMMDVEERLTAISRVLGAIAFPFGATTSPTADRSQRMAPASGSTIGDAQALLNAMNNVTNQVAGQVHVVVTNESAQLAEIQSLKDQLAGGSAITQEQLDGLVDGMQARVDALGLIRDSLQSIGADPANPTPAPAPIEEPPATGDASGDPTTGDPAAQG
jgi:hypothetical protein